MPRIIPLRAAPSPSYFSLRSAELRSFPRLTSTLQPLHLLRLSPLSGKGQTRPRLAYLAVESKTRSLHSARPRRQGPAWERAESAESALASCAAARKEPSHSPSSHLDRWDPAVLHPAQGRIGRLWRMSATEAIPTCWTSLWNRRRTCVSHKDRNRSSLRFLLEVGEGFHPYRRKNNFGASRLGASVARWSQCPRPGVQRVLQVIRLMHHRTPITNRRPNQTVRLHMHLLWPVFQDLALSAWPRP